MRLGWIWGTLFACFSLQSQAIVKEYTYDDGDRLYTSESSSASWVYQHDAAGNRLSELRYKGNAPSMKLHKQHPEIENETKRRIDKFGFLTKG